MSRPARRLGMGLVFLSLLFGLWQKGWAEEEYSVRSGDTLYGISRSFGVSVEALRNANGLEGSSIHPKQVLVIPPVREKKTEEASRSRSYPLPESSGGILGRTWREMDSYVVRKGDSLSKISEKVGLPMEEIRKVNGLHTSALKIGQVLYLRKGEPPPDEKTEPPGGKEEPLEWAGGESEKEESAALGRWNNLEERSLLVRVVRTFLGVPYKLGGSTLKGIDCSAFVRKIYEVFNIQLPRTTREQFAIGKKVQRDQLEEGDLVFFREGGNRAHVGIYVGENQFVHASSHNRQVKIDDLDTPYYSKRFLKGVRVKELEKELETSKKRLKTRKR